MKKNPYAVSFPQGGVEPLRGLLNNDNLPDEQQYEEQRAITPRMAFESLVAAYGSQAGGGVPWQGLPGSAAVTTTPGLGTAMSRPVGQRTPPRLGQQIGATTPGQGADAEQLRRKRALDWLFRIGGR